MGLFEKLKQGLLKTKQLLQTDVRDLFKSGEILDEAKLERFEARLIRTDMGVAASAQIVGELRTKYLGRTLVLGDVWGTVKETLKTILPVPLTPVTRITVGLPSENLSGDSG